jgi:hypothetical protein
MSGRLVSGRAPLLMDGEDGLMMMYHDGCRVREVRAG